MNAVDPARDATGIFQQAVTLHQQGLLPQARALYERVLALQADHFEAQHLLGILCLQSNVLDEALFHLDRAIALRPEFAVAHNNRGLVLMELKRHDEAVASFERTIALKPDYTAACYHRGNALLALARYGEAAVAYDRVIALAPEFADAHNGRGRALQALGRFAEALASFHRAITFRPEFAEARYNHGNALLELRRFDQALASFDQAIALRADFAEAWNNRGTALLAIGQIEEAMASYDRAIGLKPLDAEPRCNRGYALLALLRIDEALTNFDQAIALEPEHVNSHWNKSLALLLSEEFEQAWPLYEWRWKSTGTSPHRGFAQPLWLGKEPIAGKTILLHAEQGLGDSVQFSRYARLVSERGARVVLEVQSPLVGLLAGLDGVSQVVARGDALPAFDCHCPLLSLPMVFATTLDSIPSPGPYLRCNPDWLAAWRERLGAQTRPRVGLVWSGSPDHRNDRSRSLALASLIEHLPPTCEYISLQTEVREADQAVLKYSAIRHFAEDIRDFRDTAALCELTDVVVSVDTSVAHVAGALGRPAWILLPYCPDWRWLLNREDSPWYSSIRLYRQSDDRSWKPVLERVAADLRTVGRLVGR
jgi:tetratricopeptide (TPR) repeat protein